MGMFEWFRIAASRKEREKLIKNCKKRNLVMSVVEVKKLIASARLIG